MNIGEFIRRITVPHGYRQDSLTLGPVPPDGWAIDAWQAEDGGRGYFLRAWNDSTGQVATIQSESSYEDASLRLREKINNCPDWVLTVRESN